MFENCKAYRDNPRSSQDKDHDFANVVIFCRDGLWTFRVANDADFLGSLSRRQSMVPQFAVDLKAVDATRARGEHRADSAYDHWRIMRKVLPAAVWECW